jgi:hypothetical protein
MLNHDCRICSGIRGIDPDGTDHVRAADETAWFKAHPVITKEERERNRALAVKSRVFGAGFGAVKTAPEQGLNVVSGKKGSWIPPVPENAGKHG